MKLVAAILISLSYASIVGGQTPASTCEPRGVSGWVRDELKGEVKVIRTFETWFVASKKSGSLEKRPRRLESEKRYDANEAREGELVFHVPGDMEFTSVDYVCGDNGKLKELRFITKDGSSFPRTTYAYDDKGRKTEKIDYFQNGSIEAKETLTYDAAGNVIEEVNTAHVHPEHFIPKRYDVYVTTKATYKYDARGNKIEEKRFSPNGALYSTHFYNYDARDRLIKETDIDKLGRLGEQSFYEYHANGQPLIEIKFNNHCFTQAGDFCKGNISSGDGFFNSGTKIKFQYDSQGNWIKQTEWHMNGELKNPTWVISKITEQEITYYRNNQR